MEKISAADAKQNFGELLDKAQRKHITITKHGRAVAVIVSAHEYEQDQHRKQEYLHQRLRLAEQAVQTSSFLDGESVFDALLKLPDPTPNI